MDIPTGAEGGIVGAFGLLIAFVAKGKFVTKPDLERHEDTCQNRVSDQFSHMNETQERLFERVENLAKSVANHQGRVDQYIKMTEDQKI